MWYLIGHKNEQYQVFKVKKASGGMRTIHNPRTIMRLMAKQLRARILLPLCKELGPHVGAYQVGKSTRATAQRHLLPCATCDQLDQPHTCTTILVEEGVKYSLKRSNKETCPPCQTPMVHTCPRRGVKIHMDLKDFFGSTRRSWIRKYFHEEVGYNHYVSSLLAELMTVTFNAGHKVRKKYDGVPQGAISSGDICNLVANWRLDQEIIRQFPDWTYSRYADDLYFSHPENLPRPAVDAVIANIEKVIQGAGYRANRKKLHVQRPNKRQKILGIVLNQKLNMPREEYRKFRSLLHNCVKHGFESQVTRAKKKNVGELHGWLEGKIAYFTMVSPERGKRLKLVYSHARKTHKLQGEVAPENIIHPEPLGDTG